MGFYGATPTPGLVLAVWMLCELEMFLQWTHVETVSAFDFISSEKIDSFLFCAKSLQLSLVPQAYSSSHVGMMVVMKKKKKEERRRRHFMLDGGRGRYRRPSVYSLPLAPAY